MKVIFDNAAQTHGAFSYETTTDIVKVDGFYSRFIKRGLDVVLVCFVAPTALIVILFFAALIAMDGSNPFYSQTRLGRNGRKFRMWKLRSMIPDADARLEEHLKANPDAAREWRTKQKLQNDHRLTRVGSFIRRTSIDELPQVWNVLNGTMSLVGPRPMMECQAELYPGKRYYRQRPGITGLWQISDRHTSDFAERAKFDDAYDREVSLMTDLRILVATIGVVFRCTGV